MKKINLILFAIATMVLASCSNKVDLYSDDGDSTVVYAMIDAAADTNYFKITHSFIGNVAELGYNYEANNYSPDEIEVTLKGVFDGASSSQTIELGTIEKYIPENDGSPFYNGCMQTYYYTDRKLAEGQEYTLNILRKEDNVNISSQAVTIDSFRYQKPVTTVPITFTDVTTSINTVEWRVETAPYKSTAAYFDVNGYFNYKELQPGSQDTVSYSIVWDLGSGKAEDIYNTSTNFPYYVISYAPANIFTLLENDSHLKNNSPAGVKRWFDKFEFKISAIGEELYNYNLVANSSSAIQDVPNYTNIENGVGLMSSRVAKTLKLTISERTRNKIAERFNDLEHNYGFIVDPNR